MHQRRAPARCSRAMLAVSPWRCLCGRRPGHAADRRRGHPLARAAPVTAEDTRRPSPSSGGAEPHSRMRGGSLSISIARSSAGRTRCPTIPCGCPAPRPAATPRDRSASAAPRPSCRDGCGARSSPTSCSSAGRAPSRGRARTSPWRTSSSPGTCRKKRPSRSRWAVQGPAGRQEMTSSNRLQFVDRDLLSFEFTRGRDIGVQLQGLLARAARIPRGRLQRQPRQPAGNDNDKYQYNARVVFQPWGDVRYSESDFESKDKPLLAVGGQFENNDLHGVDERQRLQHDHPGRRRGVQVPGLSLFAEYFDRRRTPGDGAVVRLQRIPRPGRVLPETRRFEVAARYAGFDPSPSSPRTT